MAREDFTNEDVNNLWAAFDQEVPHSSFEDALKIDKSSIAGSISYNGQSLALSNYLPKGFIYIEEFHKGLLLRIMKLAQFDNMTLYINGETGTGKSHLAKFLHLNSPRKDKEYGKINCASYDSLDLLKSDLFGHKKGSFTGATEDKVGFLEKYSDGTLLIDEIDKMPKQIQGALLHFLDDGSFYMIGNSEEQKSNVRLIFAGSSDLEKKVEENSFLPDLYWRIQYPRVTSPSLRSIDIVKFFGMYLYHLLIDKEHFERFTHLTFEELQVSNSDGLVEEQELERVHRELWERARSTTDSFQLWFNHKWPGNHREFIRYIETALILDDWTSYFVKEEDFSYSPSPELFTVDISNPPTIKELDKSYAEHIASKCRTQKDAASVLGISENTLRGYFKPSSK